MTSGCCPECGRDVLDALLPLVHPERVSRALRHLGNSYLGLLGLLPVVTGTCLGWIGLAVVGVTTLVRVLAVWELRFRADTGNLPLVGQRINRLWVVLIAEAALIALWSGAWVLAVAGDGRGSWLAALGFGLWLAVALVGAAMSGHMGGALSRLLGNPAIGRLFRAQVRLSIGAATGAAAAGVLFVVLLPIRLEAALGLAVIALPLVGLTVVVVIFVTMTALGQLAGAADRARAAAFEAGRTEAAA